MRVRFFNHPLLQTLAFSALFSISALVSLPVHAEVINIPLQRSIATQPITTLEIVAIVKTLLSGRVLSIKKQSSYSNPDCHTVKFLEDKGEFQVINVGCFSESIAQSKS
jgi:hypothetical protein